VLYRLSDFVARRWNRPAAIGLPPDRFGDFARHAFAWIDWLPVRLTALGFAIVGDFEGAAYCWRRVATRAPRVAGWPTPDSRTLLLGSASGALGFRVLSAADAARYFDEPGREGADLGEPNNNSLRAVVGLVWRALVLWLLLLALLTIVAWFA
jgi:adenosylcobinamide-phosphate synthase